MPSWKDYELLGVLPFWMPYVFVLTSLFEGRVESGLAGPPARFQTEKNKNASRTRRLVPFPVPF